MDLRSFKFQLPDDMKPIVKPNNRVSKKIAVIPKKLQQLCEDVVNRQPLPKGLSWSMEKLQQFDANNSSDGEFLVFEYYSPTFKINHITGRNLIRTKPSDLVQMNIQNFDDIKSINSKIREVYKIEKVLHDRSITLPPLLPDTHYKIYKSFTGHKYENCTRSELWRLMKILRTLDESYNVPGKNHFEKLAQSFDHIPENRRELIGLARRLNLYAVKKYVEPIVCVELPTCSCIPPCECKWTDKEKKSPWVLAYISRELSNVVKATSV